jgi:uncharacterized protein (TIRG00374 family)
MNKQLIKRLIGIIGILLSIALIWLIVKKYDLKQSWDIIKTASPGFYVAMILVYLSTFYFRALRWKCMLVDIGDFKLSFLVKTIIVGFAGNNLIPARGGELLRMEFFSRQTKVSRTTSLTSIVLEKILDALVLLAFLVCAGFLLNETSDILTNTIKIASLIFLPMLAFLIFLRVRGRRLIQWVVQKKGKTFQLASNLLSKFYTALLFMRADTNTLRITALTVLIWSLEGLVFVIGMKAAGVEDSVILIGIIALCIVNFGILVPSSPGYIGVFHAATVVSLSLFGIATTNSLAAAIIVHSCQFLPTTLIGIVILITAHYKPKQKHCHE